MQQALLSLVKDADVVDFGQDLLNGKLVSIFLEKGGVPVDVLQNCGSQGFGHLLNSL